MRGNLRLYLFGLTLILFFSALALSSRAPASRSPRAGGSAKVGDEKKSNGITDSKRSSEKMSSRSDEKSTFKTDKLFKQLFVPAANGSPAKPDRRDDGETDDPDRPA